MSLWAKPLLKCKVMTRTSRHRQRQRIVQRKTPRIYGDLQRPKRDWGPLLRFVKLSFFSLVFLAAAYGLFYSSFFTVKNVDVQGASLSDTEAIIATVKKGGSIWSVPQQSIMRSVFDTQPVNKVSVLRGLPDSVRIVVEERQPILVWQSGTVTSLADENGIVFLQYSDDKLPDPESSLGKTLAGLPHVRDTKSLAVARGDVVVSRDLISFLGSVKENLLRYFPDFELTSFEVADTTYDVTAISAKGMRVQMNSLADSGAQVRNLVRLVQQENVGMQAQVDLRIDRWAYVKGG